MFTPGYGLSILILWLVRGTPIEMMSTPFILIDITMIGFVAHAVVLRAISFWGITTLLITPKEFPTKR